MELKKDVYQPEGEQKGQPNFVKKQKIEIKESQSGFFACLENQLDQIHNLEEREQVNGFIKELKVQCCDYLKILADYRLAEKNFDEARVGDMEDKENARLGLNARTQDRVSKKSVILDNLNILNRLFDSYALDCSWYCGFADESQFENWVIKNVQELEN